MTILLAALVAAGSLTADVRTDYQRVRDYFIRAAEKMPESDYAFRPTPDVRSFAQQVAHVADDQYNLCAPARGEKRDAAYTAIEDSLSTKAQLVPALKAAFAYCDSAYDALTDAAGAEPSVVKNRNRFSMLNWNLWHTWEHYGNVVVYLRMKGLVPPSSEKSPAAPSKSAAASGAGVPEFSNNGAPRLDIFRTASAAHCSTALQHGTAAPSAPRHQHPRTFCTSAPQHRDRPCPTPASCRIGECAYAFA